MTLILSQVVNRLALRFYHHALSAVFSPEGNGLTEFVEGDFSWDLVDSKKDLDILSESSITKKQESELRLDKKQPGKTGLSTAFFQGNENLLCEPCFVRVRQETDPLILSLARDATANSRLTSSHRSDQSAYVRPYLILLHS